MKRSVACLSALSLLSAAPLMAQSARDDEIAALRAELSRLTARLDQLEQRAEPAPVVEQVQVAPPPAAASWPERIRLSGDLRYRHETINDDATIERNRQRIRTRVGVTADVTDAVTVGLTLSSGGDDPISGNQTLDGGASRKSIGIDRAFFAWKLNDELTLRGGKMGNPYFRPGDHHLIFDGDLNPEGLALSYSGGSLFANFGGLWVDERSSSTNDAVLLAAQGGYRGTIGEDTTITAGVSYYGYSGLQGHAPLFTDIGLGNRLDANGNFLSDFDLVELFAQAEFDAGGQPLRVFADYVENTGADNYDTGYAVGFRWRRASAPGSWDIGWAYEDIEADAVFALFTDSDFGGGGTDSKGHVFRTNYVLKDRLNLALTYFLNERGSAAGNERDYNRLQADVSFRY